MSLRNVLAAMEAAAGEDSLNGFLHVACSALESEMLSRLIRIFEASPHPSSFWFLYKIDPGSVGKGIDVKKLREFSARLKKIRDKVFVHIDKNAVFDPDAIYRQVNIEGHEIVEAVEELWKVLNRLYSRQHGKAFHLSQATLDDLRQGFRHDLSQILKSCDTLVTSSRALRAAAFAVGSRAKLDRRRLRVRHHFQIQNSFALPPRGRRPLISQSRLSRDRAANLGLA
jgi:hypothetical protein